MRFILASASPRRKELLNQIGIEPEIITGAYSEIQDPDYLKTVQDNALGKLLASVRLHDQQNTVVIAADTIVVQNGKIFGKPQDAAHAKVMLQELSGKKHRVITGLAIYYNKKIRYNYSATDVYFKALTQERINAYVASGEPLDKAGAYGIQGLGSIFVNKIDGCYSNVVGLPLALLNEMLEDLDIHLSLC